MKPQVLTSQPTTEGAGVRIRRAIGTQQLRNLDPFLMLDYFDSDRSADYLAGFPSHPHRGFITFTYMLDGRMEHQDSMGHKGVIGPGDAQWMKAARVSSCLGRWSVAKVHMTHDTSIVYKVARFSPPRIETMACSVVK